MFTNFGKKCFKKPYIVPYAALKAKQATTTKHFRG
jgi:hypothetical protein